MSDEPSRKKSFTKQSKRRSSNTKKPAKTPRAPDLKSISDTRALSALLVYEQPSEVVRRLKVKVHVLYESMFIIIRYQYKLNTKIINSVSLTNNQLGTITIPDCWSHRKMINRKIDGLPKHVRSLARGCLQGVLLIY